MLPYSQVNVSLAEFFFNYDNINKDAEKESEVMDGNSGVDNCLCKLEKEYLSCKRRSEEDSI